MPGRRKCADLITSYIELTEETEPRLILRMACIISGIASVMQRKIFLPWGDMFFYPNMYIVLVGPPAARKGTAMAPIRRMLDRIGVTMAADESSKQRLVQILRDSIATDITPTGAQCIHCSTTIHAAELTVFLGYNNMNLLTYLNDWFDCRDTFRYSTIAREDETISNVWVNMLGATTPTLLQQALPIEAVGAGFTSRTFFVFAADKAKVVVMPSSPPGLFDAVCHDMEHLMALAGPFQYSEDFLALYADWRQTSDNIDMHDFRLNHYVDRRATHFMKLAMIFSVSRSDELVLRPADFTRAKTFMETCERVMPRVFEGMGANVFADVQARIMSFIRLRKRTTEEELTRMFKNDLMFRDLQAVLQTLQAGGEISIGTSGNIQLKSNRSATDEQPGATSEVEEGGKDNRPGHIRTRPARSDVPPDGGSSPHDILPS